MNELTLSVTGMTCIDCARHVEKALWARPDIIAADVAYPQG
ncbi:cation transporter [Afipia birgiae]|nr:cation transporter [Afipia birgiae]